MYGNPDQILNCDCWKPDDGFCMEHSRGHFLAWSYWPCGEEGLWPVYWLRCSTWTLKNRKHLNASVKLNESRFCLVLVESLFVETYTVLVVHGFFRNYKKINLFILMWVVKYRTAWVLFLVGAKEIFLFPTTGNVCSSVVFWRFPVGILSTFKQGVHCCCLTRESYKTYKHIVWQSYYRALIELTPGTAYFTLSVAKDRYAIEKIASKIRWVKLIKFRKNSLLLNRT